MSQLIDMTNQQCGEWTVLYLDKNNPKKGTFWMCKCSCGTIKSINASSLRNGSSNSCGCKRIEKARENNGKFINEIGNKYGKLTVIAKDEELSIKNHRAHWICKCDCGNLKTVSSKCLRDGKTNSCGCLVSIGEANIQKVLEENGVGFATQYSIFINNKWYRFDFAIIENEKVIKFIEFDGIQHYDTTQLHWNKDANQTIERDKIKNEYCLKNNIPLYRIPYNYRDEITLELLTDEKFRITEEADGLEENE